MRNNTKLKFKNHCVPIQLHQTHKNIRNYETIVCRNIENNNNNNPINSNLEKNKSYLKNTMSLKRNKQEAELCSHQIEFKPYRKLQRGKVRRRDPH